MRFEDEVSELVHRVDVLLPRLSDDQQITLRKDVLVALLYRKASELLNNALPALPGGYIARSEVEALVQSRVSERTKRLSEALANLSGKLTLIEADERYKAVWMSAYIHGQKYEGPTWEAELIAARRALESE